MSKTTRHEVTDAAPAPIGFKRHINGAVSIYAHADNTDAVLILIDEREDAEVSNDLHTTSILAGDHYEVQVHLKGRISALSASGTQVIMVSA